MAPDAAARAAETFRGTGDREVRCVVRVADKDGAPDPRWSAWAESDLAAYAAAPGYRASMQADGPPTIAWASGRLIALDGDGWDAISTALAEGGVTPIAMPMVAPFEDVQQATTAAFALAAAA
jgi:hypothetical protein